MTAAVAAARRFDDEHVARVHHGLGTVPGSGLRSIARTARFAQPTFLHDQEVVDQNALLPLTVASVILCLGSLSSRTVLSIVPRRRKMPSKIWKRLGSTLPESALQSRMFIE